MIIGVFGKPGAGKTTYLASVVKKNEIKNKLCLYVPFLKHFLKPYDVVYCNDSSIRGCLYYPPETLGKWKPVENSLILMSECAVNWSNRDTFKGKDAVHRLWAYHRHLKCDIIWESQSVDVDIKLRQRTDSLWLLKRGIMPHTSVLQKIRYKLDVDNENHVVAEMYSTPVNPLAKLIDSLIGNRRTLHRRKYYRYFDSWADDGFPYTLEAPCRDSF